MRSARPAERPFAPRTYGRLERVTPRVYLFRNVVNSVVVLGDDAAAVIDTQVNAPMARRLLARVKDLSDKPLRWAINTHYHWDHTAGNAVFRAGPVARPGKAPVEFEPGHISDAVVFRTCAGASASKGNGQHWVNASRFLNVVGDTRFELVTSGM